MTPHQGLRTQLGVHRPAETLETGRLLAERLREEHLPEIQRMHRDPRVMATLGGLRSDEESARYLRDNLDHWDRYGYGIWVFRNKTDGRFVGRAGLRNTHVGGEDEVELAYALVADYWNKGLATEMARAILKVAFEDLGLIDVVCFTLPANRAARDGEGWLRIRARRRARGLTARALPHHRQGVGGWLPSGPCPGLRR